MFNLDELKEIRKKYLFDPDMKELRLQPRARGDASVKKAEDLNQDEKNKIISALYLYRKVRECATGSGLAQPRTEQEVLDEIQNDFYKELLTPGKKTAQPFMLMAGKPRDNIMMELAHPNEDKRYMSEVFFNYILSENGKRASNIRRSIEGELMYTMSYDVEEIKKENAFRKQLDPNNPIYTQPRQKLNFTPEQLADRRKIVEKLIVQYRKMEHDDWYEKRKQTEETNMQRVVRVVNSANADEKTIKGPQLLRVLIAAQNLSLDGEKNYLEEMLKQPAVEDALQDLIKSGQLKTIVAEAQKNEQEGRVDEYGLLEGHSLTQGEVAIRAANQVISEHPNAVSSAKQKLSERNSFLIKNGDKDRMKKARLIEVVARTQGKNITKTMDANENRILQVDDGKEQTK